MTASWVCAATLGCAALLMVAPQAQATDLQIWNYRNSSGGREYRIECEPGSYLTGFSGRAGAWVDTMAITCSPWLNKERRLGESVVRDDAWVGSSGGGDPTSADCPAGWVIAGGHRLNFSQWDDSGIFHSIDFECVPPDLQSEQRIARTFGSNSPKVGRDWEDPDARLHQDACPPGEFLTGIRGRTGLFVDALGLICGSAPEVVLCETGRLVCGVPIKPAKPDPMVQKKRPSDFILQSP